MHQENVGDTQGGTFESGSLTGADLPKIEPLFEQFPYKTAQRRIQKLDQDRQNRFYLAGLGRSLEAGVRRWWASQGGRALALAGLDADKWHSEIYGLKMGKIQPWMNTAAPEAGAELLGDVLEAAEAEGFEHLSVRLDGEDYRNLHLFETNGFHLIDVSIKFTRPMPFAPDAVAPDREGWAVRLAGESDAGWMRELGGRAHAHNHFANDPDLPLARTEALFAAWVGRCIDGLAYRIYVLEDVAGRGRGFVIYLRNGAFAEAVGRSPIILDYVILDPDARGGGVGPWFVQESLKREADSGFDYCELRTSQHNHPAINCYEKLEFRICATDFILHRLD